MVKDLFEDEANGNDDAPLDKESRPASLTPTEPPPPADEEDSWIPLNDMDLGASFTQDPAEKGVRDKETVETDPAEETIPEREWPDLEAEAAEAGAGQEQRTRSEMDVDQPDDEDEIEAAPWNEIVEIPSHGIKGVSSKSNILMIVLIIILAGAAFTGLFTFLKYRQASLEQMVRTDDRPAPSGMVSEKIDFPVTFDQNGNSLPEDAEKPEPNSAPVITGDPPKAITVGEDLHFEPSATDENPGDRLTFFIANQPPWTTFDLATGVLTGTPGQKDIGTYDNIVILVSDDKATASLPGFTMTVLGRPAESVLQTPEAPTGKPIEGTGAAAPETEKAMEVVEKASVAELPLEKPAGKTTTDTTRVPYNLPDLKDLIRDSRFGDAAASYLESVKQIPQAYSLKLEVDCMESSVQSAFKRGGQDGVMFILPMTVHNRDCFVILWGLYPTYKDAIQALPTIPESFTRNGHKPELVRIEKYTR